MDLGSAWEWCERAVTILACREGTLEQRCQAAFREALAHAKPHLPESYLSEFRAIDRALVKERCLSADEAWFLAMSIVRITKQTTFLHAVDEAAVQRWQEGAGP